MYHDHKCYKCRYCKSVDCDSSVYCDLFGKVEPRTGCTHYEPKYYKPSPQALMQSMG